MIEKKLTVWMIMYKGYTLCRTPNPVRGQLKKSKHQIPARKALKEPVKLSQGRARLVRRDAKRVAAVAPARPVRREVKVAMVVR